MTFLLMTLLWFVQADAASSKLDCAGRSDRSAKQIRKLKPAEIKDRIVSCELPRPPGDINAKGSVIIQVLVGKDGSVECLTSVSGHPLLRAAALAAVRNWRFRPLIVGRTAHPFSGVIAVPVSWDAPETGLSCAGSRPTAAIRAVLDAQRDAWNRGDLEGYMDGYDRSPHTEFVGGDSISRGWQTVLDRYKKKYDSREKMGVLTFSDVEVTMLSRDAALVLGRWRLKRAGDEPHGTFSLLFRRKKAGWRIVHDHSSSA